MTATITIPTMTLNTRNGPSKNLLQLKTVVKPPSRNSTPTPTSMTAPLTSFTTKIRSCYLCDEQNPGDFSPTTRYLSACLLCNRDFCPIHKAEIHDTICSINHLRYYHDHLERARREIAKRRPVGDDGQTYHDRVFEECEAEETLVRAGIYPSLGERDKMRWSLSPVSESKRKELETSRAQDAERRGTKGRRPSMLIETKDWVGADIAV